MALPKLETQKYSMKMPSTGKPVEYRPYLVSEEKVLLLAMESGDSTTIIRAVQDIIGVCTFGKIDPTNITTFDLEYIFLQLRIKSVGETSTIKRSCSECKEEMKVTLDLSSAKVEPEARKAEKVDLDGIVGITLGYPQIGRIERFMDMDLSQMEISILSSLVNIYDSESVYEANDTTTEELVAFVGSFSTAQRDKVVKIIKDQPTLTLISSNQCMNCGYKNPVEVKGLTNFFT